MPQGFLTVRRGGAGGGVPQGFLTVRRGGAGWGRAAGVSYCKN